MENPKNETTILKNVVKIFTRIGIWSREGKNTSSISRVKFFFIYFSLFFPIYAGMLGYLYISIQYKQRSEQLRVLSQALNVFIYFLFTITLEIVGNKIMTTLAKLSHHNFGKPPDIEKLWAKHEKVTNIMFYFVTSITIMKLIQYFLKDSFCELKNLSGDPRCICGLLAPVWFPFELGFYAKGLFILMQYVYWIFYFPASSILTVLVWGCVETLQARLRHLRSYVRILLNTTDVDLYEGKQKLIFCIKYHQEIMRLIDDINSSIGVVLLFHYGLTAANLALFEYKFIDKRNVYILVELFVWLGFEFMICSFGQAIENEVTLLATDLFNTSWTTIHPELRQIFRIFLMKLNQPKGLRVGPLIRLNMEYMKMVLQNTYTVFMFLNNVLN